MLGRAYERGWGTPRDVERAVNCFRQAAEAGDGWAAFNLGDLCISGNGVPRDPALAYTYYILAAQRGVLKALNILGVLLETGVMGTPDRNNARLYFQAAAEGGDCWGCLNLSSLFLENGDPTMARLWLERSFDNGFPAYFARLRDWVLTRHRPEWRDIATRADALCRPPAQLNAADNRRGWYPDPQNA